MTPDRGQPELAGLDTPSVAVEGVPPPHGVRAMREMLGLRFNDIGRLTGLQWRLVSALEGGSDRGGFTDAAHRAAVLRVLHDACFRRGARWSLDGAGKHSVSLAHGRAGFRRTVKASVALMGYYSGHPGYAVTVAHLLHRVAERMPGTEPRALGRAVHNGGGLDAELIAAIIRELEAAGCTLVAAPREGWRAVSCDVAGCRW